MDGTKTRKIFDLNTEPGKKSEKNGKSTENRRMKSENRKILMFVDNFSGHSPHKNEVPYVLSNIKLHYFPANCTSVIHPMDQGIINAFKIRYRTHIVKRRIEQIEYGGDEGDVNITVLDAIRFVSAAWDATSRATITNCFRKAGFCFNNAVEEIEELDSPLTTYSNAFGHLNQIENSELVSADFLTVDEGLSFGGVLTDEEIIAPYLPHVGEAEINEESEEDEEPAPVISKAQAFKALADFKMFLLQSSQDHQGTLKLVACIEKEMESAVKPVVQSNITSFFN